MTTHRLATLDRSNTLTQRDEPRRVLLVDSYEPAMVTHPRSRTLTPGFEIRTGDACSYGSVVYAASQSGPEHVAVLILPTDGSGRWQLIDLPPLDEPEPVDESEARW